MHSHSPVVTAMVLDPNQQLMINVVPELKLLVGGQLPIVELPSRRAQSPLQLVFRRTFSASSRGPNIR